MATANEIAWAAGLFEGEGTTTMSVSGQRQPRMSLNMIDEDVVRRFHGVMGCGNVRSYHYPPRKRQWQWSVQSRDDVLLAIGMLKPHLGKRRLRRALEIEARAAEMVARNGPRLVCRRGHSLEDPGNLYIHMKTGKRHCMRCRADYQRNWNERRRLPRPAA